MKKKALVLALIIILTVLTATVLVACNKGQTKITYVIEDSTYINGDVFNKSSVKITATLRDGSVKNVSSSHLVFDASDIEKLELKDDKFTKAGDFTVGVWLIEQNEIYRDEFFLGDWQITVKPKK